MENSSPTENQSQTVPDNSSGSPSQPASGAESADTRPEPSETGFVNELVNPKFSEIGYIQVYTGDGKGKTTASLGLTFRALGRGWNVLVILFTKGGNDYGELFSARQLSPQISRQLTIVQAALNRMPFTH